MKKNLFLAALAGVALVGCAKNEVAQVTDDSQREISFTTPVLALNTKADEISGTTFPTGNSFSVFGYYAESDFSAAVATTASKYMDDVEVTYDSSYDVPDPNTGTGGWHSTAPYYWPKNGKLTFDAYSPSSLPFTSTADGGLKLTSYEALNTYANQIDVLYSDRTCDNTYSNQTSDSNTDYDGVDIKFNHAMSVVKIFVKAKNTTAANVIRIKSIDVYDIAFEGDFSQTMALDCRTATSSKWTVSYFPLGQYPDADPKSNWGESHTITITEAQYGNNMIVLPQKFTPGCAEDARIEIRYYINNGGGPVEQICQFKLADAAHKVSGTGDPITAWEMGKRYTYNITFSVDEIYFAPAIEDWEDVEVAGTEI